LKRIVELIQKPFEPDLLSDLVEDKLGPAKLAELNMTSREIITSAAPSDTDIESLLSQLRSIQKPNTI
jgi:hypothetical protein